MFDYTPSASEQRQALQTLRDAGVVRAEFYFSGGNDEGGVDSASYFDAEGNTVTLPEGNAYENRYWQGGREHNDGWVVWASGGKRPATEEEIKWSRVSKVMEAPIYERYYTFAGEFYVDGTLTWDVTAGTHKMSGQESHEVWESFEV